MSHVNDPPSSILDKMTIDDMPASLRELAGHVGVKIAIKLVKAFGGHRVNVAAYPTKQSVICKALTVSDAVLLAEIYGGRYISIPSCRSFIKRQRNKRIISLRDTNKSLVSLSREFDLSERQICKIVTRLTS